MTEVDSDLDRLRRLFDEIVARCAAEPGLDDFLLWWGGTLEYWVHVVASGVGNHSAGWAARSEIPYVTGVPASSAKTDVKWADGAVLYDDGLLALLEVKSIPMRTVLGSSAQHIPRDLAALASANWGRSVAHERGSDTYTDAGWWDRRGRVTRPWGLAIGIVHGRRPLVRGALDAFGVALIRGKAALHNRHSQDPPPWLAIVDAALDTPLAGPVTIAAPSSEAAVFGWAVRPSL